MKDDISRVRDVPDRFTLVDDTREQRHIFESIGVDFDTWKRGSLFVDTEEGEYSEVYWFPGLVPYLNDPVTKVHPDGADEPNYI